MTEPPAPWPRIDHERPVKASETKSAMPAPGDWIDSYRVLRKLGQGGMGAVFEAEHAGRRFALKLVLGELQLDSIERFRREGEAAAKVDRHPNIVAIHKMGDFHGRPYLVFDFVSGQDLLSLLRKEKQLPAHAAVELLLPIIDAIAYAHRAGVIHRDLKPANILLRNSVNSPYGVPLVADFGLAKILSAEQLTATGQSLGTPAYMAPEQIEANSTLTPAVDIWALGVILFESISGENPFHGDSPLHTIHNICSKSCPTLSNSLTPEDQNLHFIIARCLEKNPQDRYPSAQALAADLRSWRAGETTIPAPPYPRRRLWPALVALALSLPAAWLLTKHLLSKSPPANRALSEILIHRINSRAASEILRRFFSPSESLGPLSPSDLELLDLKDPEAYSAFLLNLWLKNSLRTDREDPKINAISTLSNWIEQSRDCIADSTELQIKLRTSGLEPCARSVAIATILLAENDLAFPRLRQLLELSPTIDWSLSPEAQSSIAARLRQSFDRQLLQFSKTPPENGLPQWAINANFASSTLTSAPIITPNNLSRPFSSIDPKLGLNTSDILRAWDALLQLDPSHKNTPTPPSILDSEAFEKAITPGASALLEDLIPIARRLGNAGIFPRLPESFDMTKEQNASLLNTLPISKLSINEYLDSELPLLFMGLYHPVRYAHESMSASGRFLSLAERLKNPKNETESIYLNFLIGHDFWTTDQHLNNTGIYRPAIFRSPLSAQILEPLIQELTQIREQLASAYLAQTQAIDSNKLSSPQMAVSHLQRAQTQHTLLLAEATQNRLRSALENLKTHPSSNISIDVYDLSAARILFSQPERVTHLLDDLLAARNLHPCPDEVFYQAFQSIVYCSQAEALRWAEQIFNHPIDSQSGEPLLKNTWTLYGGTGLPPPLNGALHALIQTAILQRFDETLDQRSRDILFGARPPLWPMLSFMSDTVFADERRKGVPERIPLFKELGWTSQLWPYFNPRIDVKPGQGPYLRLRLLRATIDASLNSNISSDILKELIQIGPIAALHPPTRHRVDLWSQSSRAFSDIHEDAFELQLLMEYLAPPALHWFCDRQEWTPFESNLRALRVAWGATGGNRAQSNELATIELALEDETAAAPPQDPLADLQKLASSRQWPRTELIRLSSILLAIKTLRKLDSELPEQAASLASASGLSPEASKILIQSLDSLSSDPPVRFDHLLQSLAQALAKTH